MIWINKTAIYVKRTTMRPICPIKSSRPMWMLSQRQSDCLKKTELTMSICPIFETTIGFKSRHSNKKACQRRHSHNPPVWCSINRPRSTSSLSSQYSIKKRTQMITTRTFWATVKLLKDRTFLWEKQNKSVNRSLKVEVFCQYWNIMIEYW